MTDAEIIANQYTLVLAVTVIFSLVSIVLLLMKQSKVSMVKTGALVFTTIMWWVSGAVHIASSPAASPNFPVAYLWFAIGVMFLLFLVVDLIMSWKVAKKEKWGDKEDGF